MSVNYRDRNYLVYKGNSISSDDIMEVMFMPEYYCDEKKYSTLRVNDVKMVRNLWYDEENKLLDFHEYAIHNYNDYSYILDFDVTDLAMFYEGEDIQIESFSSTICGGYYGLKDIFKLAHLNDENFHQLLPKLLYNSNDSELAYNVLNFYSPGNMSYVIYNKKTDKLNAINVEKNLPSAVNYDGVYYSLVNGNEQLLSNNPKLLSEFSNIVYKLPENTLYEDGMVRKLKWK